MSKEKEYKFEWVDDEIQTCDTFKTLDKGVQNVIMDTAKSIEKNTDSPQTEFELEFTWHTEPRFDIGDFVHERQITITYRVVCTRGRVTIMSLEKQRV